VVGPHGLPRNNPASMIDPDDPGFYIHLDFISGRVKVILSPTRDVKVSAIPTKPEGEPRTAILRQIIKHYPCFGILRRSLQYENVSILPFRWGSPLRAVARRSNPKRYTVFSRTTSCSLARGKAPVAPVWRRVSSVRSGSTTCLDSFHWYVELYPREFAIEIRGAAPEWKHSGTR